MGRLCLRPEIDFRSSSAAGRHTATVGAYAPIGARYEVGTMDMKDLRMAVSRVIAAEADKFVSEIRQRAYARNLSVEGIRWHLPHDPADQNIEFALTSNGQPRTTR